MTIITKMREVLAVENENKSKVEDLLKKDDEVGRGSITVKNASSLDIDEDVYFIIIDASEERIHRAKELVKGLAKPCKDAKKVLEKLDEQENSAIEGFGNILG